MAFSSEQRKSLASIRKLIKSSDWTDVAQGLALLSAIDDSALWALLAEGIRSVQEEYDTTEITPAQLRWGLENLDISEARLEELGMTGMVPPFQTSCADHTGHSGGWMLEWDGSQFVKVSDHLTPESELISQLEQEKAQEYAAANAPWPTNEECEAN